MADSILDQKWNDWAEMQPDGADTSYRAFSTKKRAAEGEAREAAKTAPREGGPNINPLEAAINAGGNELMWGRGDLLQDKDVIDEGYRQHPLSAGIGSILGMIPSGGVAVKGAQMGGKLLGHAIPAVRNAYKNAKDPLTNAAGTIAANTVGGGTDAALREHNKGGDDVVSEGAFGALFSGLAQTAIEGVGGMKNAMLRRPGGGWNKRDMGSVEHDIRSYYQNSPEGADAAIATAKKKVEDLGEDATIADIMPPEMVAEIRATNPNATKALAKRIVDRAGDGNAFFDDTMNRLFNQKNVRTPEVISKAIGAGKKMLGENYPHILGQDAAKGVGGEARKFFNTSVGKHLKLGNKGQALSKDTPMSNRLGKMFAENIRRKGKSGDGLPWFKYNPKTKSLEFDTSAIARPKNFKGTAVEWKKEATKRIEASYNKHGLQLGKTGAVNGETVKVMRQEVDDMISAALRSDEGLNPTAVKRLMGLRKDLSKTLNKIPGFEELSGQFKHANDVETGYALGQSFAKNNDVPIDDIKLLFKEAADQPGLASGMYEGVLAEVKRLAQYDMAGLAKDVSSNGPTIKKLTAIFGKKEADQIIDAAKTSAQIDNMDTIFRNSNKQNLSQRGISGGQASDAAIVGAGTGGQVGASQMAGRARSLIDQLMPGSAGVVNAAGDIASRSGQDVTQNFLAKMGGPVSEMSTRKSLADYLGAGVGATVTQTPRGNEPRD